MDKIDVKNVIVSFSGQRKSENYKNFIEIISKKSINIIEVQAGDKITIEKNLHINILWPSSAFYIDENEINNNSIVCKLVYKKFSLLFTGDIEEAAEKSMCNLYDKDLESTILKVGHHGSKTSSYKDFIAKTHAKYALIGVGKDNKYGHPSDVVMDRLDHYGCTIYRTDKNGEIHFSVDKNGNITKISCMLKR